MARPHKPQWHEARRCWKVTIEGRTRYFGRDIPPGEKPQMAGIPERAWTVMNDMIREGAAAVVNAADPTVAAVCELYLVWAECEVEKDRMARANYRGHRTHLGRFCHFAPSGRPALGSRKARGLVPADLERAVAAWQAEGYAPHYVANLCRSVQAAFNWATRPADDAEGQRLLAENPFKGHRAPMVPRGAERFAERAEAAAFLRFFRGYADRVGRDSATARFDRRTILLERVLIRTGCRPGEACVLQWGDIRWDAGRTSAGHAYARAVIPYTRWKTGKATGKPRTIYFSPALTRALRRLEARPDRHETYVFTHIAGRNLRDIGEDPRAGVPWSDSSALAAKVRAVRRAAIAAGVAVQEVGANRLVNYRWRHTAISTLLMMGIDVPTVAELTGTSPAMIYRTYGHLLSEHLAAAAERLSTGRRSGPR